MCCEGSWGELETNKTTAKNMGPLSVYYLRIASYFEKNKCVLTVLRLSYIRILRTIYHLS